MWLGFDPFRPVQNHIKTVTSKVAMPGITPQILKATGVHGWIVAAVLEDMKNFKGKASCESRETESRYPRCIRHGSVEAPTLWMKLAMHTLWNVDENRGAFGAGLWFAEEGDKGIPQLQHIERKQNGLAKDGGRIGRRIRGQWHVTEAGIPLLDEHARQRNGPTVIEGAGQFWNMPFVEKFDHLDADAKWVGKCEAGVKKRLKRGTGSRFKEAHLYHSRAVSLEKKHDSVLVTGQDEGGQRLGGSDDERNFPFPREEEED